MARKKKSRSISASTRERLRAMREKYGLGEYKNNAKRARRSRSVKKKRSVTTMARKHRKSAFGRAVRYARSKKGRDKLSAVAVLGYAVVGENLVDQFASKVPVAGLPTEAVKLAAGYYLKKKGGMVGQIGTAMFYISAYKLGKQFSNGGLNLGNLLQTSTSNPASTGGATFA